MIDCNLCNETVDDNDILAGLCSNCFEIYGYSDYSDNTKEAKRVNNAARRRNFTFSFSYNLNATTNNNCPPDGNLRRNSPTPASVTQIQISKVDLTTNFNTEQNFLKLKSGDYVYLQDNEGNNAFECYQLTSDATDGGSCVIIPCLRVDDNGTISSNNQIMVTIEVQVF